MGCFTVLRSKKKKPDPIARKPNNSSFKETSSSSPTTLPEPEAVRPSLQSAPPSFRTRTTRATAMATQPTATTTRVANSRTRALSAPSTLDVPDGDPLASAEFEEQEEPNGRGGKDLRVLNPQPLPLPSPQGSSVLKNLGSFSKSSGNSHGGLVSSSGPLPLPPFGALRSFSFKEISTACQHFSLDRCVSEGISSTVYRASFGDDSSNKKLEASVTRLLPSTQGFKEFVNEASMISSLQHPQLCKLLGFHAREGSDQRMLVYERLFHGSLDRHLYGKSDSPSIDWASRMKVAISAARGLAFLHEEGPFQAMYNEFSAANIQVDKDFSAKLSGYGCVSYNPEVEISNTSAAANLSVETLERGLLTPKSNVWSFGVVLLELLTGRRNQDPILPREERNLVKWSRPYLTDDCRLSLIMDSRLKGRYNPKAARTVADIALKCLQKEPSERPTIRVIVESLENVQELKYSCRFPLLEPSGVTRKQMLRSPSLNGIILHPTPRVNFSPSPPSKTQSSVSHYVSPPRPSLSIPLPPRTCASTLTLEDYQMNTIRRSPPPSFGRASVEGF